MQFFLCCHGRFGGDAMELPPVVSERMRQLVSPGIVQFMCLSGRRWYVVLQYIEGEFRFTNGWGQFGRDVRLSRGNLIVFRWEGEMKFTYKHYNNGFELVGGFLIDDMQSAMQFNFCRVLTQAICSATYLPIPDSYAAAYADFPDRMVIQIPTGKQWVVGLKILQNKVCLYYGWSEVLATPVGWWTGQLVTPGILQFVCCTGRVWSLRFEQSDKCMRFTDGWGKFARDICLKLGHFIVFRWEGDMKFSFRHFDLSTLEVDCCTSAAVDAGLEPCFFRIIRDSISDQSQLDVPKCFVNGKVAQLIDSVTIESRSGRQWEIGLKSRKNTTWLRYGWPSVARALGIRKNSVLVFTHKENITGFLIEVFDPSGHEVMDVIIKVESDDKEAKTNSDGVVALEVTDEHEQSVGDRKYVGVHESMEAAGKVFQIVVHHRKIKRAAIGIRKAYCNVQATTFERSNVVVLIHAATVGPKYELGLPEVFVRRFFDLTDNNIDLKMHGIDVTWSCSYRIYNSSNVKIYGGWKNLAISTGVGVGDICVFEIVETGKNVLLVHIFKKVSG